ncbi:MAG: hypothetical protein FJ100_11475 [Deltaproteobacteria bacterium]|nr:hypothetical protein [Deltaproteobacteria bacterium]
MSPDQPANPPQRDCMAPDTEPTDEELSAVTEAVAVVLRERAEREAKINAELMAAALRAVGLPVGQP